MAVVINGNGTVTGVSVGGLPDGIVDTDMLAANAVTAAKASGSVKGITMADQWRIPTTYTVNGDSTITSLERNDTDFELIGTGMTESSGTFTFPSTGKYLIMASFNANSTNVQYIGIVIKLSTDSGSSFNTRAQNFDSAASTNYFVSVNTQVIVDITNTSTHQIRFHTAVPSTITVEGTTSQQRSGFTFIRLGDT